MSLSTVGITCPNCGHCLEVPRSDTLGVTPRQRRVLNNIAAFIVSEGHSPSYDQIAQSIGRVSKGSVAYTVSKLQERGYVVPRAAGARRSSRGINLTAAAWQLFGRDGEGKVLHAG